VILVVDANIIFSCLIKSEFKEKSGKLISFISTHELVEELQLI